MRLFVAGLLVVLVAGCARGAGDTVLPASIATSPVAGTAPDLVRVLVLGDSFAVGEGVGPEDAWPAQLAIALEGRGVAAADVEIIGGTGWTSRRVADALERAAPAGSFDLVVVAIGVNDHFYQFGADRLGANADRIFSSLVPLVSDPADVLVLSIVDWRATPRGAAYAGSWRDTSVAPYNEALAGAATSRGHRYLDVTSVSLAMADDPSLVADDGIHGSSELYARWVELMLPAADAVLTSVVPTS